MNQVQLNQLKALVDTIVIPKISKVAALQAFPDRNGWRISRTEKQVVFGCGLVKVNKRDLLIIANFLESKEKYAAAISRLTAAGKKYSIGINEKYILKIGSRKLRQLVG